MGLLDLFLGKYVGITTLEMRPVPIRVCLSRRKNSQEKKLAKCYWKKIDKNKFYLFI